MSDSGSNSGSCDKAKTQEKEQDGDGPSSSKRKKESYQDYGEVRRELECPICFNIPFNEILLCTSGHSICKMCRDKMVECPICKSLFTEAGVRNLIVEGIISTMKHPCHFDVNGCPEVTTGRLMDAHIKGCLYNPQRMCPCPLNRIGRCDVKEIPIKDFMKHMMSYHPLFNVHNVGISSVLGSSNIVVEEIRIQASNVIQIEGSKFLSLIYGTKCNMCFMILCICNGNEGKEYKAQIWLTDDNFKNLWFAWCSEVIRPFQGVLFRNGSFVDDVRESTFTVRLADIKENSNRTSLNQEFISFGYKITIFQEKK